MFGGEIIGYFLSMTCVCILRALLELGIIHPKVLNLAFSMIFSRWYADRKPKFG